MSALAWYEFVTEAGLVPHAGAATAEAGVQETWADLQAAMHALRSFPVMLDGSHFGIPPFVTNEANVIPAVTSLADADEEAAAPGLQLVMQQPGGHGLQSAGLQLAGLHAAWPKDSVMAKPEISNTIISTCFIFIQILKELVRIDVANLFPDRPRTCHSAVTHMLNTCYSVMPDRMETVNLHHEVENEPCGYPDGSFDAGNDRPGHFSI